MRRTSSLAVAIAAGMFAFAIGSSTRAAIGAPGSLAAAWLLAIAVGALAGWRTHRRATLDPSAISRPLAIVSGIAAMLALVQLGRMTAYMHDPSRGDLSFISTSEWEVRHNCATSYYVAAQASYRNADFYSDSLYTAPDDDPTKIRKPLMLGPFRIDVYEYPPPFLLLPRALIRVVPGFPEFRALWFGLSGLFLLGTMLWLQGFFAPAVATRTLLWMPLLWAALGTLSVLQKGNLQPVVIAAGMLAMGLIHRGRSAWGGLVLAFAIVSKLYPGMLVVYLLARRQWRPVAWTAVFSALFAAAIALELGPQVYETFADHLPRLLSGEAFPAFRNPMAIASNVSVPGLVFKLKLFGATGVGFDQMRVVGWLYTLTAAAMTLWLSRRRVPMDQMPMLWLTVLLVGTLRSPFLPLTYGTFPALWLICLLAPRSEPTTRNVALLLLAWVPLALIWPNDWRSLDPRVLALWSVLVLSLMIGSAAWWMRSSARGISMAEPQDAAPAA